jgi:hypothetical protein
MPRLDGTQVTDEALKERWRLFSNAHPKVASAESPLPQKLMQRPRTERPKAESDVPAEPPEVTVPPRETEQSRAEPS